MKGLFLFFALLTLSSIGYPNGTLQVDAQNQSEVDAQNPMVLTHLIERTTTLAVLDASSLVQAGLQEKGFQIRFVQPIDKGLQKYQENPGYLRVIVFDPPPADIPAGDAGDELHVFVPLRVAVIQTGQGSKVSALPYANLAATLSEQAGWVMRGWGEQIATVIAGLPE